MNIEQNRFNMIEQQIRPWNVLDKTLLDMLLVVKRENYFPAEQRSLAFMDTELPLPDGSKALFPRVEARIVQEVAPQKNESVLLIGAQSGYLAALLAHMTRHVTVLEVSPQLKALAEKNLADNGVRNVSVLGENGLVGQHTGSYDLIIVAGGLEALPENLKNQLNQGGRLLAFVGTAPVMHAQLVSRTAAGFEQKSIFETVLPLIAGAQPVSHFQF